MRGGPTSSPLAAGSLMPPPPGPLPRWGGGEVVDAPLSDPPPFVGEGQGGGRPYNRWRWSLSALPMTETELRLMAAAAITGLSNSPNHGNSTPAAIGTPRTL